MQGMVTIGKGRRPTRLWLLGFAVCLFSLTLGASAPGFAATLLGTVRNDVNGNGVLDPSDPPLPGVLVQLRTGATRGFTLAQTTSDANGFYGFTNISAGTYRLVQIPPVGTLSIRSAAGPGGVAVDANTIRFTLNGTEFISNNNFLDRRSVVSPSNGSLSGTVFRDVNGNNAIDGADAVISGVTIQLFTGLGVPVRATTTDFSGAYSFTTLPPGTYQVVEIDPANHVSVAAFGGPFGFPLNNNTIRVTVNSGFNSGGNNFLDRSTLVSPTVGSISGFVVRDTNGNNGIDGADVGIAGVTVQLFVLGNFFPSFQTTTGANGAYSFANLPPGFYRVVELDPANHFSVAAFAGANGQVVNNNTIQVTVFAGLNSGNNNFLDRQTVVSPTVGTISGFVFRDTNGNNTIDAGDVRLQGVTVRLFVQGNIFPSFQTTTDANGAYAFGNLPPGFYQVQEIDPANHISINAFAGPSGSVLSANLILVQVAAGANSGNNNFLDRLNVVTPTVGIVSGRVFRDTNGNNGIDFADVSLQGVLVQLFNQFGGFVAQTITDANGAYAFGNLLPGTYQVLEVDPPNHISINAVAGPNGLALHANLIRVSVFAGVNSANNNFLDRLTVVSPTTGSISGTVLRDNGNGVLDAGDVGIAGVTLQLFVQGSAVPSFQTTTGANGSFSFANLPPGFYRVQEFNPANHASVLAAAGVAGFVLDPDNIQVSVVANVDASGQRFLDRLIAGPPGGPNTISGFAIRDTNQNGIADNEAGLAGMSVSLTDQFGFPLASVVTDGTGSFSFSGLAGGTYFLTATPPAGLANTNAIAGQGGLRLSANSIRVTTSFGNTSYPAHLFLAGP
jgi:protocatechuate 3,4-dioxygenase beta subunit